MSVKAIMGTHAEMSWGPRHLVPFTTDFSLDLQAWTITKGPL